MSKIITVANQKGGVGKTATAVNLAACLAESGKRVILVDLDYQANATSYFGLKKQVKKSRKLVSEGFLNEKPLDRCLQTTYSQNLQVVGGDMALMKASKELSTQPDSVLLLREWLEDSESYGITDYFVIDVHPSLDLLFQMAMVAADSYLVPLFAEADAWDGLSYMFDEVARIKRRLNKKLYLLGLTVTSFDKSSMTHRRFLSFIKQFCNEEGYNYLPTIGISKAIASSSASGVPLIKYLPNNKIPARDAYVELAKTVEQIIASGPSEQATPTITEKTKEATEQVFEVETIQEISV